MMLAGDDYILHSGILGKSRYFSRIKIHGVKRLGGGTIFNLIAISHTPVHDPFAYAIMRLPFPLVAKMGIKPPVDKHGVIAPVKELASLD